VVLEHRTHHPAGRTGSQLQAVLATPQETGLAAQQSAVQAQEVLDPVALGVIVDFGDPTLEAPMLFAMLF